jgi:glycosyltransferase involved in cell wall biosynthesis
MHMRKTVAIDASLVLSPKGGDASYWTGLVKALAEARQDFDFLLLTNATALPNVPNLPPNFRWRKIPGASSRWFSLVSAPLAARRSRASAYHTQYSLSPLAKNGITTIHDVSVFIGPEWFRPRDRFLLSRSLPSSVKRAAKIITVSNTSKSDIVKHLRVPANKIAVTLLAADSAFRPMAREDAHAATQRLDLPDPYILSVSTQWPRKNFQLAYDAVEKLSPAVPHKLVVTGRFDAGARPRQDRIHPTGFLPMDTLPSLYSMAQLYICTSHYEGFGIPVLEAMASGTPVLTSAGGALREVAADAAIVMDDMSAAAWASKIEELLNDSSILAELRQRGLERAAQFSWSKTAQRTLEVYREVTQ